MKKLVDFLVKPFLEEDTNLEYDGSVPPVGDSDYEYKMLKTKKDVKRFKEFLINNKSVINENLVTQLVDGGTNELSPFASVKGYYKYSLRRSENCGYRFLQDIFDPSFVYGNEKSSPPKKFSDGELKKILEAYNSIDKLYLEYVLHVEEVENASVADDGSSYESKIGELPKTEPLSSQKNLPLKKALGNGYDGDPSDTKTSYKHTYNKTPRGRHI